MSIYASRANSQVSSATLPVRQMISQIRSHEGGPAANLIVSTGSQVALPRRVCLFLIPVRVVHFGCTVPFSPAPGLSLRALPDVCTYLLPSACIWTHDRKPTAFWLPSAALIGSCGPYITQDACLLVSSILSALQPQPGRRVVWSPFCFCHSPSWVPILIEIVQCDRLRSRS